MIVRSTIAAFTTLFLSGAALAAPVLKSDVTISNAIVTVGDMFDNAGLSAEEALFRAPLPGTSGVVSLGDIDLALSRIGIEEFDAAGLDGVRVTRSATIIDETALADLIAADLTARG